MQATTINPPLSVTVSPVVSPSRGRPLERDAHLLAPTLSSVEGLSSFPSSINSSATSSGLQRDGDTDVRAQHARSRPATPPIPHRHHAKSNPPTFYYAFDTPMQPTPNPINLDATQDTTPNPQEPSKRSRKHHNEYAKELQQPKPSPIIQSAARPKSTSPHPTPKPTIHDFNNRFAPLADDDDQSTSTCKPCLTHQSVKRR